MIRHNILVRPDLGEKYVQGVLRLKDPAVSPWPNQDGLSAYDFFVYWHHQAMMVLTPPTQLDRNAAHTGPAFLPWHRYFLLIFEEMLRQVLEDDEFRLPYWDWSADAELLQPALSPLWESNLMGRFLTTDWRVRLVMDRNSGTLTRTDAPLLRRLGQRGGLPARQQVQTMIRDQVAYDMAPYNRSVNGLRNHLEGWIGAARIHNNVHLWVGGDMEISTSPNDPVFFLHHSNVDRIWAAWQSRHPSAGYVPLASAPADLQFHRIDDPLHSFFSDSVTPRDMLDVSAIYEYDTLDDLVV